MQRRTILNGKSKLTFHCLEVTGVKIYTVKINLCFYSKEIEQTRQILSILPEEIHGNFLFKQLPQNFEQYFKNLKSFLPTRRVIAYSSMFVIIKCFPGGSDGKESACNVGDLGLIPGLGRSPGGRHGNSLQYSCLENSMGRGAWRAAVHGVTRIEHF